MGAIENLFWLSFLIMVIIGFTNYIIPFLLKGNIVFGSRFPNEIAAHPETEILKRNFKHVYLSIIIPFLIAFGLLSYNSSGSLNFPIGIFTEVLLSLIIYVVYNKKAKELKNELLNHENIKPAKELLSVDTKFRDGKFLVSIWWFLPSLIIIVLNILVLFLDYNKIPAKIIMHYNLQGAATETTDKSYLHVMLIPLISISLLCMFIAIYFSIKTSRQQIDSNRPETSMLRDRHFRLIWSDYSVILCTLLVTWMLFVSLNMNRLFIIPENIFKNFNIAIPLLILLSAVTLAVKTGQSGSRLKLKINETAKGINNVDDDSYWKLGMFYYNPHDPSIWVPKRFGVGWTINFGRPAGFAIIIALAAFVIIVKFILKK